MSLLVWKYVESFIDEQKLRFLGQLMKMEDSKENVSHEDKWNLNTNAWNLKLSLFLIYSEF